MCTAILIVRRLAIPRFTQQSLRIPTVCQSGAPQTRGLGKAWFTLSMVKVKRGLPNIVPSLYQSHFLIAFGVSARLFPCTKPLEKGGFITQNTHAFPCTIPLEILGNVCYTGFASWGMRLESARDRRTPLASAQFTPNKLNSLASIKENNESHQRCSVVRRRGDGVSERHPSRLHIRPRSRA